jgi:hypothetical protein
LKRYDYIVVTKLIKNTSKIIHKKAEMAKRRKKISGFPAGGGGLYEKEQPC